MKFYTLKINDELTWLESRGYEHQWDEYDI